MIPIHRGLRRGRRANLDKSCLSVDSRNDSSPGQSPDTSWEGTTHCTKRVDWVGTDTENFTSVFGASRPVKHGKSWSRANEHRLVDSELHTSYIDSTVFHLILLFYFTLYLIFPPSVFVFPYCILQRSLFPIPTLFSEAGDSQGFPTSCRKRGAAARHSSPPSFIMLP